MLQGEEILSQRSEESEDEEEETDQSLPLPQAQSDDQVCYVPMWGRNGFCSQEI